MTARTSESASEGKHKHTTENSEEEEVIQRSSPSGKIVYKAILREADEELERPSAALFWSGLAAGMSMGFSLIGEGLLRTYLPDAPWQPLVAKLGYSVGFLVVILGRQQLFTENTLTPVLPLLLRRDARTLANVLRLWGVVLLANLIGAFIMAFLVTKTPAFDPKVRDSFIAIGHGALKFGFGTLIVKGIFAGWLIALIVWLMPFAESARFWVIIVITWVVGVSGFGHVVAGAAEVFPVAWMGEKTWSATLFGYLLPTLIGNIIGGGTLVAALNHAQVVTGENGEVE